jgi:hypothetical protein
MLVRRMHALAIGFLAFDSFLQAAPPSNVSSKTKSGGKCRSARGTYRSRSAEPNRTHYNQWDKRSKGSVKRCQALVWRSGGVTFNFRSNSLERNNLTS